MIHFIQNEDQSRVTFLTPKEERALFERRDLILESMASSKVPDHRQQELVSELREAVRGYSTALLSRQIDDLARKTGKNNRERVFCSDELSLTVIYMTIQEHFLPMIKKLATTHQHPLIDQEDLEQRAIIGLQNAIKKYEPKDSKLSFGCYASWAVRNSLKEELQLMMAPIRLPKSMVGQYRGVNRAYQDFWQTHHKSPTAEELAKVTGCGMSAASAFLMSRIPAEEVDETMQSKHNDPRDQVFQNESTVLVRDMIDSIDDEKGRKAISLFFGIDTGEPSTLQEIAVTLGYKNRINAYQIKEKALQHLRQKFAHLVA